MDSPGLTPELPREVLIRLRRNEEQTLRLARLLAVLVAHADGQIDVPYRWFDELPADIKLVEHYDALNDMIVLRTGRAPQPAEGDDAKSS